MGQMRFVAPRRERLGEGAVESAYVAGTEGVPWRSRCAWIAGEAAQGGRGEFALERAVSESGNLHLPWQVEGHGELVLATASLMERSKPYNLPVELARGAVNRLRNQLADWQAGGLSVPQELDAAIAAATLGLSRAVTSGDELQAADLAEEVLKAALDAGASLVDEYIRQMLAARHQQAGPLPTLLGGALASRPLSAVEARMLPDAWNSALVPFVWRDIERRAGQFCWDVCDQLVQWSLDQGWRILAGPLLCLSRCHLPDWIYLWEDDFDQLQASLSQFLRAAVERYRGKVHIWYSAARMNTEGAIAISEEQRLRLVVTAIDEVRRADPQAPILVGFDQPWGEYLATAAHELSPLHFADSLIRADLGVAGLGLELNLDYWPGGTRLRDPIEFSRHLDRWSLLGLPLVVFLTVPSGPEESASPRPQGKRPRGEETSPATQHRTAQRLIPLLLAKHYVQGLIWNRLCDADPGEFADGGLLDAQQQPKPVLKALASIRQQHLQ